MDSLPDCNIDENIVKKLADSFLKNGMAKVGFQYIDIDGICDLH